MGATTPQPSVRASTPNETASTKVGRANANPARRPVRKLDGDELLSVIRSYCQNATQEE